MIRASMPTHPLAGKPAPRDILVNVPRLVTAYFANRPDLQPSYAAVADAASGLDQVGVITDNDSWEYGLWALLALRGARPRIEHVVVRLSDRMPRGQEPCYCST